MKIVLGLALVAVSTLIGFVYSERVKLRKKIFEKLIEFNGDFSCDIALFRSTVIQKLEACDEMLAPTFLGAANNLKVGEPFVCADSRLSTGEKRIVEAYVNGLGKSDLDGQLSRLNLYGEKLKSVYSSLEKSYQKSAKLYSKLGFSFGLIVFIIII